MNDQWSMTAGVFLTKEEFSIAADLAKDQSISEYLSQVVRKHLVQSSNTQSQTKRGVKAPFNLIKY